ncbi:MAG TPA: TolC family protein [Pyrinomonadaceae bacterium]|jgi:outer membrane protein TolC
MARLLKRLSFIIAGVVFVGWAHAQGPRPAPQTPTTQSPTPAQAPQPSSSPQTITPSPSVTPAPAPAAPAGPQVVSPATGQVAFGQLSLDDVLRLANAQVSGFRQAQLNERLAEEDVRQARAAFLPKVTTPLDYIYTSPAPGLPRGEPRAPSYIANNAIGEYQAVVSVAGDVDISGRLRATLARNRALLAAARAGTEVARSTLRQATVEAYYGLALAAAQTRSAEQNLAAAQEFEHVTSLLLSGGEVAPVDLTRAQLQTVQRQGELEQARAGESVAADALRVLVGYDQARALVVADLATLVPAAGEVERLTADMVQRRPEVAQFEAQVRAARQDVRGARAERLPQLSYTINGGFDTDSLRPPRLREHTGFSAVVNLSLPIFDWGATRSRERQAQLKLEVAENERALAVRGFAQQFSSARTQALSAAARIRLAAQGLTLAQSNLDASTARYRAGEAQIIEVTDAQTTLAAQRLAFFQALFDYQVALARLRQAAGQ